MSTLQRLISLPRSIIPACDVDTLGQLATLARATCEIEGITAYKLPGYLSLDYTLRSLVYEIAAYATCGKPVIFDYQKAGNDIPDLGGKFARSAKKSGATAAILFPFAGPATQKAWTEACLGEGLRVIIGAEMTHKQFLVSQGGYIADDAPDRIFELAMEMGVRDFVIPGTKLDRVQYYVARFNDQLGEGEYVCYSPGLVAQGGEPTEVGRAAGKYWHGIVGRGITEAPDPGAAALAMVETLLVAV